MKPDGPRLPPRRTRRHHHCVYVGMTGLDPDLRFDEHKAGIQANRFVFAYDLREAGYGVWQA